MSNTKILVDYDFNGNYIKNIGNPINAYDAANKDFIDNILVDDLLVSSYFLENAILAAPSSNSIRVNNVSMIAVTQIFIDNTDLNNYINSDNLKNLKENDNIVITSATSPGTFIKYTILSVINNTTYYTLNVTYNSIAVDGAPTKNQICKIKLINNVEIIPSINLSNKIFIDATLGVNIAGRGSISKPYQTVEYALTQINNTASITGNITSGNNIITNIADTSNIHIGAFIYGTSGLTTYGMTVVSKTSTTLTLSSNATTTSTGVSITYYNPYTLVLSGDFTATSNWYKLGVWFECGTSQITYSNFTLFNVNTEGYVPIVINGGYWIGTTSSSKFISSISKNITPDIFVDINKYTSLFISYNIETTRSTGRFSQNNIKCKMFTCSAGIVANMSDVFNTIWEGYCYGLLGGITTQSTNFEFTGMIETPTSTWSFSSGNTNVTFNGHMYGGLIMYGSHGTINGDCFGLTNQLAGQTYMTPIVLNGSIKNYSGTLTVDGCHAIINGGCNVPVTHTAGKLYINQMSANYTTSGSNYPHAVFAQVGGEQTSISGSEGSGMSFITMNATNGNLTLLGGSAGGVLIINTGSTLINKGAFLNTQFTSIAGTLVNHGHIRVIYRSAEITGKIINKGTIETWSDSAANDGYQPTIRISTGTFIQDGGHLICRINNTIAKSGILRKTGTGTIILKGQPSIYVSNGLAPIEIIGSALNGNIMNFGCITNCAPGVGLISTFSNNTYNSPHYPVVDLIGGLLYEDTTYNFTEVSDAYLI